MGSAQVSPEDRFHALAGEVSGGPGVTPPEGVPGARKFGSSPELRVNDKIFAMLVRGRLVLKLPRQRVDELIKSGLGERFDTGRGRPLKEWLSLRPGTEADWSSLAKEAMEFVASKQ